jgi:hypothetical protein
MHRPIHLPTTILPARSPINWYAFGHGFILIALTLFFGLWQAGRAVTPAPDSGYPNGNTAEGANALDSLTTGSFNTAIGFDALQAVTTGSNNTANGAFALAANTTGFQNTATGSQALITNTTGNSNTANGAAALQSNSTGNDNTANGYLALQKNTTGFSNTANGASALADNTEGHDNTATGFEALFSNTLGSFNTANGYQALQNNTTGIENIANGLQVLFHNTSGNNNTAPGLEALFSNTTGSNNTVDGLALENNTIGHDNSAEGFEALANNTTGSSNIALGSNAGINLTTGSNNIDIGAPGAAGESKKIRIGKQGMQTATFVAGIRGATVASGVAVVVSSNGQLGTVTSSARFKDDIKPMDKTSEALLKLKPVTFRYKEELDPDKVPQFGLIAEEVAKANPDLVLRDDKGEIYSVRYQAVNAMLLNEFLKEHRKVEDQQATITRLESKAAKQELIATQKQKQIEALTATVQKVSDQVALSKPSPQLVANP